jgi:hypothetical protein
MPTATLYQITTRQRARQFMPTSLGDFTTDAGVGVGGAVVLDPLWSLYSIDIAENLAIFVRLPPDTDLWAAAFIPQAQFDAARTVLTLPLDALPALSADLPGPANLIFLFSIGRCGTTLANHILNTVPDTFALSEPRAFVTLAMARRDMPAGRAQALIAAITRFMFRPPPGRTPRNFAIKFHSQVLYQADLFHRAFPQAKCLFMYRDAKGWANSMSQFLQNLGHPMLLDPEHLGAAWRIITAAAPLDDLAAVLDVNAAQTPHPPLLACCWAHNLNHFRGLVAAGMPFHTLRYDDLTSARERSIRSLLAYCDLSDSTMADALSAFDRDSQEGTAIGRGGKVTGFGKEDYASLINTLESVPHPLPWDVRF